MSELFRLFIVCVCVNIFPGRNVSIPYEQNDAPVVHAWDLARWDSKCTLDDKDGQGCRIIEAIFSALIRLHDNMSDNC